MKPRIHHTVKPDNKPSFNEWARYVRIEADKDHNVTNPKLHEQNKGTIHGNA